jgi:hypothetical protein
MFNKVESGFATRKGLIVPDPVAIREKTHCGHAIPEEQRFWLVHMTSAVHRSGGECRIDYKMILIVPTASMCGMPAGP